MSDAELDEVGFDPRKILESLDTLQVGAAASKIFAASIGEIVVVLSRSAAHKHYSLADIEWMVMPPVTTGQFYLVETADKERGFRVPIAIVTWAFVSEEVDAALQQQAGLLRRLRPDQWKCGTIGWLIDAAGNTEGVKGALQWLAAGPFRERPLKMTVRGTNGVVQVTTLGDLLAQRAESAGAAICQ